MAKFASLIAFVLLEHLLAAALALSMAAGGSTLLVAHAEESANTEMECQYGAEDGEEESGTDGDNGEEGITGISGGNGKESEINPCGDMGEEVKVEK